MPLILRYIRVCGTHHCQPLGKSNHTLLRIKYAHLYIFITDPIISIEYYSGRLKVAFLLVLVQFIVSKLILLGTRTETSDGEVTGKEKKGGSVEFWVMSRGLHNHQVAYGSFLVLFLWQQEQPPCVNIVTYCLE
jgi:hypothetical protein